MNPWESNHRDGPTGHKKLCETTSCLPLPQRSALNTEITLLLVPESTLISPKLYGICLGLIRVPGGLITASANSDAPIPNN